MKPSGFGRKYDFFSNFKFHTSFSAAVTQNYRRVYKKNGRMVPGLQNLQKHPVLFCWIPSTIVKYQEYEIKNKISQQEKRNQESIFIDLRLVKRRKIIP